ncbi:alkaline phosphatase D family protein [Dongia soli]|uniref:Alkaline phosphatase D family protein n=1 Tax=Dongia soli TaxID=600628 RepID=A0ABU5EFV1_9PROT|nr:alkaline phosphatase D family protein [Dongia soli]MDY0884782.1 alkaline phosphatase D family protein [Dongia soli]
MTMPRCLSGPHAGPLLTRRAALRLAGASLASGFLAAPYVARATGTAATARQTHWRNGNPFSLGVAAGEPSVDGFVLWTRLAPEPIGTDPQKPGGMDPHAGDIEIAYEIAADPDFRDIHRSGKAIAEAAYAHSVHLELAGLAANRPYWYRFASGDAVSRAGRAVTAPLPGTPLDRLKIAVASCSNYERGYFSAYRHLTDEQPDLVLFLGDYIYEKVLAPGKALRPHSHGAVAADLHGYRDRYAQYRLDEDLQRLHAELPMLITLDDHEVQNDYAGEWSETFDPPARFLERRAAGFQAFYEHMPVRPSRARPQGPDMRIYERFSFGDLAEITMLDGRQYRDREACYGPPDRGGGHLVTDASCPERLDLSRSILGATQERWLHDGIAAAARQGTTRWNLFGQDVLMAQFRQPQPAPEHGFAFSTDRWDGYPGSRARFMQQLHATALRNPVVLSGDIHSFWANDLHLDAGNPASPLVASEFVGTSITSPGPDYRALTAWLPANPQVKFFDSRKRGYMAIEITRDSLTAHFRTISDVTDPKASLSTLRSFVIENGRLGTMSV